VIIYVPHERRACAKTVAIHKHCKLVAFAIKVSTARTERVDYREREISLGCLLGNNPKTLTSGSQDSDVRLL